MLILLSPAKTLDFQSPSTTKLSSTPVFQKETKELIQTLQKFSKEDISKLMKLSDKLSQENYNRYSKWPNNPTKQAILAFKGDVYTGLAAENFTDEDLTYAQQHLGILSGLYGLLHPLDIMQPYRLEMKTKLMTSKGKNLYDFWADLLTEKVNDLLAKQSSEILVNLASNEYFKAIKHKQLKARVITPVFKDYKNGQYKIIGFFAKKARGMMANYLIKQRIEDPLLIQQFSMAGYSFQANLSTAQQWVFTRKQ